jgi:hypothetical protein
MMSKVLLLLAFPFFSFFTTPKIADTIPWSAERRLGWEDFRGKPDNNSTNAALTSSGIEFGYNYGEKGFGYTINCMFEKNKSWGRLKTEYILSHEQGHFDISEIHARKLNKALKSYRVNPSTLSKDVQSIYQQIMKEQTEMQSEYDEVSDHSRNKQQQAIWLKRINTQLEQLKDYAGYR